ncbi:AEC family transporter [Roseobacter sp. HKCCD9010]|uniref:AEC family transporter n=1 Tax=unclassified Roseobacter TaxID=196798 RepID=UPI0014914A75|nr:MULTISPECIES: AEC family transporter [unclassified Roseobacter]MBF9049765.1 AEC family transporter [Rhodobacterales bacterium HKCCD4356]NNV13696.1 AEC family transporter [Roseobacter sp. HKCCD7357]NNV16530.1 AEC family transporter [Roseobacter sp. HKCCD8768]NNV25989.1 AEC family transporter [Roseobacter sp. HKCCD8192]NNV30249.1 AEC family transporter [Roseobacter sp. HKCCD9061]
MADLLSVVLPVFLVIGAGYLAVWRGLFSDSGVDGLMDFTQKFAIPCLLFMGISTLDLEQNFDWRLLASFYTGSTICFFLGMFGARALFGRPWQDSVAIGFACLFANTVLLGLPIMERAYGPDSLGPNFAIVALHAAFCYLLGITAMEIVRADSNSPLRMVRTVGLAMFRNPLMIGVGLGFVVNLTGLPMPGVLTEAINLMIRAALPAALFGLGGVLYRYKPEGDAKVIAFICVMSLIVHPAIAYGMGGQVLALSEEQMRSVVITAAMAPGVNTYIFANMYGAARRVAASSVLIGTALTVLTASIWLAVLP